MIFANQRNPRRRTLHILSAVWFSASRWAVLNGRVGSSPWRGGRTEIVGPSLMTAGLRADFRVAHCAPISFGPTRCSPSRLLPSAVSFTVATGLPPSRKKSAPQRAVHTVHSSSELQSQSLLVALLSVGRFSVPDFPIWIVIRSGYFRVADIRPECKRIEREPQKELSAGRSRRARNSRPPSDRVCRNNEPTSGKGRQVGSAQ